MDVEAANIAQSPFAVVTFIAAPALLTNATSLLAASTINRMLRTRDRMQELYEKSEHSSLTKEESERLLILTNRVERQAALLLRSLGSIYVALGCFAAATLVTLLGASLAHFQGALWFSLLGGLGLVLGFVGLIGIVWGSLDLFQATQLSLVNIRDEAELIRKRQSQAAAAAKAP